MIALDRRPRFRPLDRLVIETSERPPVNPDRPSSATVTPLWLRELRRDKREQVL